MTEQSPDEGAPGVEEQVRAAMEAGGDIAGEVERITRDALASGKLDFRRARAVVEAVGRGASAGAEAGSAQARAAVSAALDGLQRTLVRSADDARLAMQEAASSVGRFSSGELERRVDELRTLESMMLDSLAATAKASNAAGSAVLDDLVSHAKRSGTRLGDEVDRTLRTLAGNLPEALREVALAGIGAARESSARAAEAASGLLSGVAGALRDTPRPSRDDEGSGDGDEGGGKPG
jgi:hypothetical protein